MMESTSMPVLFVGHGSPTNALENNEFTKKWYEIGQSFAKPKAILCISAHWETQGTQVTSMDNPRTIHDFGGFQKELYDMQYPAKGSSSLALQTKELVKSTTLVLDQNWGLDHGCWSVLCKMYPDASIPVVQLSLDYNKPAQYHFDLAKELLLLRKLGILIVASGNIVHNLRLISIQSMSNINTEYGFDWAKEANEQIKKLIVEENFSELIHYSNLGKAVQLAIPTPEHYLPLLYALSLKSKNEKLTFFNDKLIAGSLSMTSIVIQ